MKRLLLPVAHACLVASVSAASHMVSPGDAVQPVIDGAAPGDVITISGGTYPDNIVITKAVRLVEADGEDVHLTGSVTWSGVIAAPPFVGFAVGSSGKGISVTDTTGLALKNVVAVAGTGLTTNGASLVSVSGGQYSTVTQNGGILCLLNGTVNGEFNANAGSQKTIAVRTTFTRGNWNTARGFLGYSSNLLLIKYSGSNGKLVVVGCRFDRQYHHANSIDLQGSNNDFLVANNAISNAQWGSWNWGGPVVTYAGRGIYVGGGGNRSRIFNNYVYNTYIADNTAHTQLDFDGGCGIRVYDTTAEIHGNIIRRSNYGISAPLGVSASNNIVHSAWRGVSRGGVTPQGTITQAPVFVAASDYVLQAGSPGIDAGIDDPLFNDLDGTRNDIGIWGGTLFDPQGRTSSNPVVVSFDLVPQRLLWGQSTMISGGQAVSGP